MRVLGSHKVGWPAKRFQCKIIFETFDCSVIILKDRGPPMVHKASKKDMIVLQSHTSSGTGDQSQDCKQQSPGRYHNQDSSSDHISMKDLQELLEIIL